MDSVCNQLQMKSFFKKTGANHSNLPVVQTGHSISEMGEVFQPKIER